MIKDFFKNSFIYTLGVILTRGLGVFLIPIYTRYLSPTEYGVIDLFVILTSIISLTIALEIHQAVVRFYQDTDDENEKIKYVSTAFLFTLAMYIIYLIISFIFSDTFTIWLLDSLEYKNIFLLASLGIFTSGLFYFTSGQLKWQIMPKQSVIVNFLNALIVAVISIYLLTIENMKIESIFIGQIVGNSIGTILSIYYTKKSYQVVFVYEKLKEMINFSFPLVFSGIAIFVSLFVDRIAIKYFLGLEELGIYGLAYKFAAITSLVMIGFQSSLTPLIYKHYKDETTPNNIVKLFDIFWIFMILVSVGGILFSKELIVFISTKEYYAASPVIPVLVLAVFFTNMYIFFPGLSIAKKTNIIAGLSILGAILNSVLNFLVIPIFGIIGAAYATLISTVIIFVIRSIYSQKYYYLQIQTQKMLICLVGSISISYMILYFYDDISILSFFIKIAFLVFLVFLVGVLIIDRKDLKKMKIKFL